MWTIQRRSSSVRLQWRDGAETRVLRPERRPSGGDPDGPGQDHARHLPPGHAPQSEGVQRYVVDYWKQLNTNQCLLSRFSTPSRGGQWPTRGHVVHPVPGGHVVLVGVAVPPLQQPASVRGDPQRQDQLHVGRVISMETSSSVLWLGHFQVIILSLFSYWSSRCNPFV